MTRSPSLKLYSKAPRRSPEAALQKCVVQWLLIAGVPGMFFLHPANEGRRTPRTGAFLKSLGMRPGAADLIIFMPGNKTHCLELKAKNGKLSPDQIVFSADCALASVPYKVADNIDDALAILNGWGVLRVEMLGHWGNVTKRRAELKAMLAEAG